MNPQKDNLKTFYALSIAWQLGFLIAVLIGGFFLLGFLADRFFGTKPIFLILGLLIGIIITIYKIRDLIIPIIKEQKDGDQ